MDEVEGHRGRRPYEIVKPVNESGERSYMDLNPLPQQRLAIEAPLGPVLVVAGPGAGKTFCLIARIKHLITTVGIAPERICAVTFTNRAAEEIAVRLKHTLGDRAEASTRGRRACGRASAWPTSSTSR